MRASLLATLLVVAALAVGAWWLLAGEQPSAASREFGGSTASGETSQPDLPRFEADVALQPVPAESSEALTAKETLVATSQGAITLEPARFVGRVVDGFGRPLAGARVTLVPDGRTRQLLDAEETTIATGADGRFAIEGRRAVDAARNAWWHKPRFPVLVVMLPGLALSGRVPSAGAEHVCAGYTGGTYEAGDIALAQPGAAIVLRAVDERGAPLADARAEIVEWSVPFEGTRVTAGGFDEERPLKHLLRRIVAVSDDAGRVELTGLWPGRLMVRVSHREMFSTSVGKSEDLLAGVVTDLGDVALRRAQVITGTVVDVDRRPIAGAEVYGQLTPRKTAREGDLVPVEIAKLREEGAQVAVSDASGVFRCTGLFEGDSHTLYVEAEGFEPLREPNLQASTGVELVLQPAARALLTLVDAATGEPVEDAAVRLLRFAGPEIQGFTEMDEASSDAAGRVELSRLGPLRNVAVVSAEGYARSSHELQGLAVGASLESVLRLGEGARVAGRVVDGEGEPVPGARVSLWPPHELQGVLEQADQDGNAEGRFEFRGVVAGEWRVWARASGYAASEIQILDLDGSEARDDLVLTLLRACTIRGTLHAADGSPAAGHEVHAELQLPEVKQMQPAITDLEGRFEIDGLAAAEWTVVAHPGVEELVLLEPGATVELELQLRVPPVVQGRVLLRDRALGAWLPAAGARVHVGDRPHDVADDGSYRVELGSAGLRRIFASWPKGGRTASVERQLDWGSVLDLDFSFGSGAIAGQVVQAGTEVPVDGLRLDLVRGEEVTAAAAPAGLDGRFLFEHLLPGTYTVRVGEGVALPAASEPIEVAADQLVEGVRLEVDLGARLSGVVRKSEGDETSLRALGVHLTRADDPQFWRTARIAAGGEYAFAGLAPGEYRLVVSVEFLRAAQKDPDLWAALPMYADLTLSIAAGEDRTLDLTLLDLDG